MQHPAYPAKLPAHLPAPYQNYELHEVVGSGGQGVVYRASDKSRPGVELAVKFYDPSAKGAMNLANIPQEASAGLTIQSEHVVRSWAFLDLSQTPDGWWPLGQVMTFCEPSLSQVIEHCAGQRTLAGDLVASWVRQIIEALRYLHDTPRLVHRDVKPGNILLRMPGESRYCSPRKLEGTRALLADLDVVCLVGQVPKVLVLQDKGGYKAPELFASGGHPRTDIPAAAAQDVYSLGVVLTELAAVTEGPPHRLLKVAQHCKEHAPKDRPTLDQLAAALSPPRGLSRRELVQLGGGTALGILGGASLTTMFFATNGSTKSKRSLDDLAEEAANWGAFDEKVFGADPLVFFQTQIESYSAEEDRDYATLLQALVTARSGGAVLRDYDRNYIWRLKKLADKKTGYGIAACWHLAKVLSLLVTSDRARMGVLADQAYKSFANISHQVELRGLRRVPLMGLSSEMPSDSLKVASGSADVLTNVIPRPHRYLATHAHCVAFWHLNKGHAQAATGWIELARRHCHDQVSQVRDRNEFMNLNRELVEVTSDILDLVRAGHRTQPNHRHSLDAARRLDGLLNRLAVTKSLPLVKTLEWNCLAHANRAIANRAQASKHLDDLHREMPALVDARRGRMELARVDPSYLLAHLGEPEALAAFEKIVGISL